MSDWQSSFDDELVQMYAGSDGGENFTKVVALGELEPYFLRQAVEMTKGLNDGSESLDAFLERLKQPTPESGAEGYDREIERC